jgi:RNA polymerase sigma-B factor
VATFKAWASDANNVLNRVVARPALPGQVCVVAARPVRKDAMTAPTMTYPAAASTTVARTRHTLVQPSANAPLEQLHELPTGHPDRARLRDQAITAWLPLAKHLARRFDGRGERLDDLTQIATVGLIKAIDRFDPGYGNDFASYAVPTIVGEIKRHFRDHTWDVRVPRRLQEIKLDLANATATLAQTLGRSPTVADLAAHLNHTEEEILEGLDTARAYRAVSLQTLVGNGEDNTELGDLFGAEDPELQMAELRASLGPALAGLPPREQQIIILRFFGNLTQAQIAERVGVSQMHVSRLLTKSLAMLRHTLTHD